MSPPLSIWAVGDGRAGIDNQVLGLAEAVARLTPAAIATKRVGWKAYLDPLPRLAQPRAGLGHVVGIERFLTALAGPLDRGRPRLPAAIDPDATALGRQDLRGAGTGPAPAGALVRPRGPAPS